MAGGNDINNELTLDVSQFTQGLERATKKLDSFNDKLDSLDNKSEKLEKDFKDLGANANQAAKNMNKIGTAAKSADDVLSTLVKDAQKTQRAFENMSDWTGHYGKSLDSLRPKMDAITKSTKELHSVTAKSTAEEAKAIQAGIQSRAKDLQDEQRVIGERIKARKQMIAQLEQIERRAETSAAYARADAYKINKDGKEVPRYRGKNISRQRELEAEIAAYQKEAQVISQQKKHITAIVGEMEYRNAEISKAIAGEKQLLQANEQQLALQQKSRQEAQKLASEKKEQARQTALQAKQLARETAAAEKQAAKDVLAAQRQAHKDLMAMKREEINAQKEMVALATGVAVAGTTAKGVDQISNYQNVDARVKAINLSAAEEERFRQKAWDMSAQEKYLSRTEAMQTRLDALTAIGYNKEGTIDKTVGSASRNAYILRSLGYETNDFSDVVKNLYGFAEARQVMDRPDEVNRSFDIARRMGVASGGKIKMADIETVARNIGDLRQTMSAEGWVRLAAVMEQFKTAGGGNGGGGGVASVGTIFKMMSLYASGKPLTNGAAMDLLGADVMNEAFTDGSGQNFKNTKEANAAFIKAVKYSGFKDTEAMSKDPVKFFTSIRGQLLDYMMQDSQFKKFFGADAKKHTYNKQGQMIGADGKVVEQHKQDDVENAAFKRFFARMGLSNKAIDGMLLTTNRSFAERSYHAADTALNSKDEYQMMEDLSKNWKANMDALKASLADFAITFEPLLRTLSGIPKALADVIRGVSEFGKENNGIATLALGFLAFKVAVLATHGPLGMLARHLLTSGKGAQAAQGFFASLAAAFAGTSGKAKETGTAVGDMASKTATESKKAGESLAGNMTAGANAAATGTKAGVGSILRVLGTLLNWAGWLTLAAMFGWAVGKWIGDIKVGSITINEHMQNLFNNIFTGWDNLILSMRSAWQGFLGVFGQQNDAVRAEIAQTRQQIRDRNEELKVRGGADKANYDTKKYTQSVVQQLQAQGVTNYNSSKAIGKTVNVNGQQVKLTAADVHNIASIFHQAGQYDSTDNLTSGGYVAAPKIDASTGLGKALGSGYNNALHGGKKPTAKAEPVHTELPPTRLPGLSTPTDQTGHLKPVGKGSSGRSGGDFVPQNAYDASIAALKEESSRDNSRIEELLGAPIDYNHLAKQAFIKEWMQGKLDDGRDPSKRKFANRAYQKGVDWKEGDIDWSNPKVQQWVGLKQGNLQNDGTQKALEFAAGKLGEAVERSEVAIENWNNESTEVLSDVVKARTDFAKFEAKNPTATKDPHYIDYKNNALAKIASTNFVEMASSLREQNKELQDQLLDDETQATRNAEKRRFESEMKKVNAVRKGLDEQIALFKEAYGEDDKLYQQLIRQKESLDKHYTAFQANQEQLRVKNTRSAYDQTMATWRDLDANLNSILSSYGERAGTDIWDIITGDQDLDIRGYLSDATKEIGGSFFKKAWGGASQFLMGEGEGTNVLDMIKNFAAGKEQSNAGWLGRFINSRSQGDGILSKVLGSAQGLLSKVFGTGGAETKALTGDQATNANTSALQQLTSAIRSWLVGAGVINTPTALPSSQAPAGVDIVPMQDRPAVDPNEPSGNGFFSDLFTSIKGGFTSIFATDGEGGIFSKIKTGFSNLFSESGGLMSKIGGSFTSMLGGVGSIFQSLLGGEQGSARSRIGGALSGAMSGFATGGWGGAVAGGIQGLLQSANGNAFGNAGHIQKFANGGAFTNGLYTSPTFFKFANGGSFSNGVMGEAGPEAVMPLQRDGSGRLGVSVNGGSAGTTNNVSINISVASDGSSSSSGGASGEGQQWKQMSNRVRMVVLEELVKQKRPGGALS